MLTTSKYPLETSSEVVCEQISKMSSKIYVDHLTLKIENNHKKRINNNHLSIFPLNTIT
jgi:hypothetical protein